MKIRTGDTVVVISGKDKGKTGSVLRVLANKNRVVVADINMRTKHVKATAQQAGQKITYEASIDVSNVMLIDPKTKKRTRISYRKNEKGFKERIAKNSGEVYVAKKASAAKSTSKKTDTSDAAAPAEKKAFWKRSKDKATEEEAGETSKESHMQEDHSVPAQIERKNTRSHSRGS